MLKREVNKLSASLERIKAETTAEGTVRFNQENGDILETSDICDLAKCVLYGEDLEAEQMVKAATSVEEEDGKLGLLLQMCLGESVEV
jgi:hypothetical protein